MSDTPTPRTDAVEESWKKGWSTVGDFIDLARKLERELAAMTDARDRLVTQCVDQIERIAALERERNALKNGLVRATADASSLRAEVERLREDTARLLREGDSWRELFGLKCDEVERLTLERDEWQRTAEHLRGMAPYADANAEVEKLRALLREVANNGANQIGMNIRAKIEAALGEE